MSHRVPVHCVARFASTPQYTASGKLLMSAALIAQQNMVQHVNESLLRCVILEIRQRLGGNKHNKRRLACVSAATVALYSSCHNRDRTLTPATNSAALAPQALDAHHAVFVVTEVANDGETLLCRKQAVRQPPRRRVGSEYVPAVNAALDADQAPVHMPQTRARCYIHNNECTCAIPCCR